jgi:hypothetical protein
MKEKKESRSVWKHLAREHLSLDMFMNALLLTGVDDKRPTPTSQTRS